jgi:hypothetical protein
MRAAYLLYRLRVERFRHSADDLCGGLQPSFSKHRATLPELPALASNNPNSEAERQARNRDKFIP